MSAASGAAAPALLERLLRPGRNSSRDVALDVLWILALGFVFIGVGIGLRDPWPPDEPRFALIAQDMLRSGDWLIPRVGGDLYADKPPFFFWLVAAATAVTGSLRAGFLVPSLLAGLGTLLLTYDLLRRARGREAGLAAAFVLLLTFQFVWQARQAQIDATLCFLTTAGLYGLLRHLCLGPARGWFLLGWVAAGLGVITKGVGFLPLLALLPFALLVRRGWPAPVRRVGSLGLAGLASMLLAIGLWFVPMIFATSAGGELLAYRNEILFQQTLTRYSEAWHHHEPFHYYLVQVIPIFWLPLVALVPWLWTRWRAALGNRDTLVAVLLAWVVLVVVFFSASAGKRGVYVLPAVPALAMAAGPWLPELLRAAGPRRVSFALAAVLAGIALCGAVYFAVSAEAAARVAEQLGLRPVLPLVIIGAVGGVAVAIVRPRQGWLAYAAVLLATLAVVGLVVNPRIDPARSGRAFMEDIERASADVPELGLVGYKAHFLLQLRRPIVHFGQARWREPVAEASDAAAWLAERPGRALVVNRKALEACFAGAEARDLGAANRDRWYLVTGPAKEECVRSGDRARAIRYLPENVSLVTDS